MLYVLKAYDRLGIATFRSPKEVGGFAVNIHCELKSRGFLWYGKLVSE